MQSIMLPVPHGLLFVRDASSSDVPDLDRNRTVWSTSTCVALMCQHEQEGTTKIVLGARAECERNEKPIIDRWIEIPSGEIAVQIVPGKRILSMMPGGKRARVAVWTNHHRGPDSIAIGVD